MSLDDNADYILRELKIIFRDDLFDSYMRSQACLDIPDYISQFTGKIYQNKYENIERIYDLINDDKFRFTDKFDRIYFIVKLMKHYSPNNDLLIDILDKMMKIICVSPTINDLIDYDLPDILP